jgi:hypothetical protein
MSNICYEINVKFTARNLRKLCKVLMPHFMVNLFEAKL